MVRAEILPTSVVQGLVELLAVDMVGTKCLSVGVPSESPVMSALSDGFARGPQYKPATARGDLSNEGMTVGPLFTLTFVAPQVERKFVELHIEQPFCALHTPSTNVSRGRRLSVWWIYPRTVPRVDSSGRESMERSKRREPPLNCASMWDSIANQDVFDHLHRYT